MDKLEYLIKTLSRTKKKDYENYVVNSIYQKLNNYDIKPVTQQYVKTSDDNYRLIDLYFPQINVGVECDESHHENQKEADKIRTLSIEKKLSARMIGNDYKEFRIDVNKPFEQVNAEIDSVVSEIKEIINGTLVEPWEEKIFDSILEKKELSINDNYRFYKVVDVLNNLFFFNYNPNFSFRSFFKYKKDENIKLWFPTITDKGKINKNGWINEINDDWTIITETNIDWNEESASLSDEYRIIFAKIVDEFGRKSYRYIGNFQSYKIENKKKYYKRVSTSIKIDANLEQINLI